MAGVPALAAGGGGLGAVRVPFLRRGRSLGPAQPVHLAGRQQRPAPDPERDRAAGARRRHDRARRRAPCDLATAAVGDRSGRAPAAGRGGRGRRGHGGPDARVLAVQPAPPVGRARTLARRPDRCGRAPRGCGLTRPLVAIDALLLRPRPTGVGRAIIEWTRALASADRGLDVAVLCTHPEMLDDLAGRPGWRLVRCPAAVGGTLRKAIWTQWRLPALLEELGADLLHTMQFVAPLRAPCPLVVTVHDLGYLRFPGTVEQPRRMYYRAIVPRSLRRARRIVCNSEATAADVRRTFPLIADRVEATPFGCPGWVQGRPVAATSRPDDAPFLFVGTLEPRKNLEGLLRAYARFLAERDAAGRASPDLVLVGGRGWRDSGIRGVLEPLTASGRVTVIDYCGPEELWRRYGMARALLFPSIHEGFGFPILEAMRADLPVMTSDRGAMAEVAGDAALLVNPDSEAEMVQGLHRLADDPSLREDLVARGRQRREHWTWEATADSTVNVYRRVLEDAPAAGTR
ncbi:glycosyltransferase [bacterium]|nr:glycosyltransferase [bacterium]